MQSFHLVHPYLLSCSRFSFLHLPPSTLLFSFCGCCLPCLHPPPGQPSQTLSGIALWSDTCRPDDNCATIRRSAGARERLLCRKQVYRPPQTRARLAAACACKKPRRLKCLSPSCLWRFLFVCCWPDGPPDTWIRGRSGLLASYSEIPGRRSLLI